MSQAPTPPIRSGGSDHQNLALLSVENHVPCFGFDVLEVRHVNNPHAPLIGL